MAPVLVLPAALAAEIAGRTREDNECGGVILAGIGRDGDRVRLLGREIHWVPDSAYDRRTPLALSVRSQGYVPALARAAERGDIPLWIHTHPGEAAEPRRSVHDKQVDEDLRETFRVRSGADVYGSVVFSPASKHFSYTGLIWTNETPAQVNRLVIAGDRWTHLPAENAPPAERLPTAFDRQVRAFGGEIQEVLARLRIAVVGCGGTGSATAEQLARLGVGSLLLLDPKNLSESNPTRVYGSAPDDVGKPKASVLAGHLRRITPLAEVEEIQAAVTTEDAARRLVGCDVVFGCTDDNAGRLVLSRLPTYYLTPVIDMGVLLSSDDGRLTGIDGRITVVSPGSACLVCRGRIDLARAGSEQLPADERAARQAEGYAPELGDIEPAVIAYTSAVASFAVAELLERLIGYGPEPEPGEILIRCHDREISTNSASPKRRHYCDPASGHVGAGDRDPFLGQIWPR